VPTWYGVTPVAKRSPILGYNHNVRYRGLVFHVQTEDSGVMSPHLFTHLFHEGVIISTRKLVYDSSASEEAIKSLMQAQHKAVLKDLKIHTFDDKIDVYLAGAEGLEPRAAAVAPGLRMSDPEITIEPSADLADRAGTEPGPPPIDLPAPIELTATPASSPAVKPRTQTADRTSKSSTGVPAGDVHSAGTVPTARAKSATSNPGLRPPAAARTTSAPPIPGRASTVGNQAPRGSQVAIDSSPEIEVFQLEPADSGRHRSARDTSVDNPYEDGVPSTIGPDLTTPSDGIPPHAGAAHLLSRAANATRPPSHGAATLPAVRAPARPAMTPHAVVARPLPPDTQRRRGDSEAVEIYAPAPASIEPPPGERSERPGQYSVNRRRDVGTQETAPLRELTGRMAVPSGLAPPRRSPTQGQAAQSGPIRKGAPSSPPAPGARQPQSDGIPRVQAPAQSDGIPQLPDGGARSHHSTRTPHLTTPMSSRTGTNNPGTSGPHSSGNVVMSRPSVIVGAPAKPPGTPAPKVRKAREDEGRGFGQGLISEKSLDEVILAYLSEDADEK
jgi:hypothetical protein